VLEEDTITPTMAGGEQRRTLRDYVTPRTHSQILSIARLPMAANNFELKLTLISNNLNLASAPIGRSVQTLANFSVQEKLKLQPNRKFRVAEFRLTENFGSSEIKP